VATAGAVLLKNEGVLPLSREDLRSLAVIGQLGGSSWWAAAAARR